MATKGPKMNRLVFTAAFAAALLLGAAVPAGAITIMGVSVAESVAICTATWRISFAPGVSLTPQTSTFTTHGETGTIDCVGNINGYPATGQGTTGTEGVYHATCLGGTGSENVSVTVPTSAGPQKLSFPTTLTVGPGIGTKASDSLVGPGVFAYLPTQGDCVTGPVTEIFVEAVLVVQS